MRFDVLTLFPDMFSSLREAGVTGRAHGQGLWALNAWNPRDFTHDVHRTVDDRPYGGGPGMVMLAEPLSEAIAAVRESRAQAGCSTKEVVLLSPVGERYDQACAQRLAQGDGAILVCGRYEGIDQRFIDCHVTHELSIGDYVLSGGEIPAMTIIDSVIRLLPGVLNDADSARFDSFHEDMSGLLDSPHYTRPEQLDGVKVPDVLLSGHHARIAVWRRQRSLEMTLSRRPELIELARVRGQLSPADEVFLRTLLG